MVPVGPVEEVLMGEAPAEEARAREVRVGGAPVVQRVLVAQQGPRASDPMASDRAVLVAAASLVAPVVAVASPVVLADRVGWAPEWATVELI